MPSHRQFQHEDRLYFHIFSKVLCESYKSNETELVDFCSFTASAITSEKKQRIKNGYFLEYSHTGVQRPPLATKKVAAVDRWSLFRGHLCSESCNWDSEIMVVIDKWSQFRGGR
jgi:hypothetical protein